MNRFAHPELLPGQKAKPFLIPIGAQCVAETAEETAW
jgi:hypothetical protein